MAMKTILVEVLCPKCNESLTPEPIKLEYNAEIKGFLLYIEEVCPNCGFGKVESKKRKKNSMSGCAEEIKCPKCNGLFHHSVDTKDGTNNYGFCFECGYGYTTTEYQQTIIEVNQERKEWELPPLKILKRKKKE